MQKIYTLLFLLCRGVVVSWLTNLQHDDTTTPQHQHTMKNWFAEWFDSKYYHILYQHRDYAEASMFMDNLVRHLNVPPQATIWDLACGKGRHSIYLAKKGFDVTGTDLSEQSINAARESEHEHLSFFQHDMRDGFRINYFDYVFNLFTSFGYFDDEKDDLRVLKNVAKSLKSNGVFVMDFLNVQYVADRLVAEEVKELSDVKFHIQRNITNGYIVKTITFEAEGKQHQHQEKVRAFTYKELTRLFHQAGLTVKETFGDYQLNDFNKQHSPRLILKC